MQKEKILFLQMFAESSAASGEGSASGEGTTGANGAADAGRQRLLELGVPANKIRNKVNYQKNRTSVPAVSLADDDFDDEQPTTADDPVEEPKEEKPKKPTFKELMEDPEYNAEMQATIQQRLKKAKGAEEKLAKLTPAIEVIARKYGLDPNNVDHEALARAVEEDESYYEEKALEMGVPTAIAKKLDMDERASIRAKKEQEMLIEEQKIERHYKNLQEQAEQMKETFPNFDLQKELQNPTFFRVTSPNIGMSVMDAYHAIHRKEIQEAAMKITAQKTAEKLSNSIQSGQRRPIENGISSQAPSATTFDYGKASPSERDAFKKQLREAWSQGKKVYPGR